MQDKAEVTFLFEQSEDNKDFILTLRSEESMTDLEYIEALKDFIDSLERGDIHFLSETTTDLH